MGKTRPADPGVVQYFANPTQPLHRQYLALRSFYFEGEPAKDVAARYGYTTQAVFSMARNFKRNLESSEHNGDEFFFRELKRGRPKQEPIPDLVEIIVNYRKKQLSVPDIKVFLDSMGYEVTEGFIYKVCDENGFARLPKRSRQERQELMGSSGYVDLLEAPEAEASRFLELEKFASKGVGVMCFLPFIKEYGIDKAIKGSAYPETSQIGKLNSILAFLALKLSKVERYGQDDGWCMDRGLGMFAGLNVLPKTTWYSTYSSAIERCDNVAFMKSMSKIFAEHGFLSDTANLDFTAIPYWGNDGPFENNWSGKRGKAIISIQAALAQDPDTGILCYGDTTIKHDNQDGVILEFLEFYREGTGNDVKYVVFDSKFTTLENLGRLNKDGIKFITIQRRSKSLNEKIEKIPPSEWKTVMVEKANHKSRKVTYSEDETLNKLYGEDKLRQVFIKGSGIKPATIITNISNSESSVPAIIRKYSLRWQVETDIA